MTGGYLPLPSQAITVARCEDLEPPGCTLPGRAARHRSVTPGRFPRRPLDQILWKDHLMAAKPKPQPADDAREQMRRALQTSMDTRQ
jgi:hypothetical protein